METRTLQDEQSFSHFSTPFALVSFTIGTILFILYHIVSDNSGILILGFFYVLFALLFNGLILLHLLYELIIFSNKRKYIFIKILILISNIPIVMIYYQLLYEKIKM